ncbi:hypothetical protein DF035_13165 [Burkholderia contaminans]|nr:hypothetical protein DF035_13165 [Burkholderia contaminans]
MVRGAGYPHACASSDAITDAYRGECDQREIHAGSGSSDDRALTLTVEMHSVASRFGDRISTRGSRCPRSHARVRTGPARRFGRNRWPNDRLLPRRPPIAYSRSPLHGAAFRAACVRGDAQRNLRIADHTVALTVKMHGLPG